MQACLAADPLLLLDPPATSGPGYIIAEGLLIALNGTIITSSSPPARAILLAHANLSWPLLSTNGTIVGLKLSHLTIDGNRDARGVVNADLCSSASGGTNDNYRTTNLMLPGFKVGPLDHVSPL